MTVAEAVWQAADGVVTAAEHVVHSYRQCGGYSTPLSINLRSLEAAVYVWQKAMHAAALDSDTNGFIAGEGGHRNEQSIEADTQRRVVRKPAKRRTTAAPKRNAKGQFVPLRRKTMRSY